MHKKILLWAFALLISVLYLPMEVGAKVQSFEAAPYQALFYWYAYRLEIDAFGGDEASKENLSIARGCNPSGVCNFDDFLRHISGWTSGGHRQWSQSTTVGDNINPDVSITAEELRTRGYNGVIDPGNLVEGLKLGDRYERILEALETRVQVARAHGVGEASIPLQNLRESLKGIIKARGIDNDAGDSKRLKQWIATRKDFKVITKTVEREENGKRVSVEEIDSEKTIQANPGKNDIIRQQSDIFSKNESKQHGRHGKVLGFLKEMQTRLEGPIGCSL